ncbi:aminoglycoside phosphotransferase family protein [Rhodobacter lacus]|uniref:Aminoglycoside phosphotransferase family protein n=1 Tax=Rhodobacter lacus TaxID=1641972 RepID=A0ABW5A6X7_9RHOB
MTQVPSQPLSPKSASLEPPAVTFMARHGIVGIAPVALPGDASARRYWRLPGAGLLLMHDPSDPVGFSSYIRVARHLNGLGLSAPRVEGADPAMCLALIEDWGEATYTNCLQAGADEAELYTLAIDALLALHHAPAAAQIAQPAYDRATWLRELQVFCDWFVAALDPSCDRVAFDAAFRALWETALSDLMDRRETLVLRDFHVDNLMLLAGRAGVARCGLLDFQDAVLGPCEYDLVSLLQDARRDLPAGLEPALLARYCAAAPESLGGPEQIRARYHLMGAQRHARICGVFVRLCLRDGKPQYLRWLPRVLGQLETALAAAGLDQIRALLDDALPDWRARGVALAQTLPSGAAPQQRTRP